MKLLCVFYCHYVLNILHYTHHRGVSARIRADGTDVSIRDIVAYLTVFYVMFHPRYGISKAVYILR